MLKGNCIVGQSGGPTTVINASLCGVIKGALAAPHIETIFGAVNGIDGVLGEKFVNLSERFADKKQQDLLINTPSAYLGSCRHRLPKEGDADYAATFEKIFQVFEANNIKYFFYIGGNDSMDTVDKLSKYAKQINFEINIIGVPKTIDNDLAVTDHTPGFGSAAKYIATSMKEITCDSQVYGQNTVTIVEIMGRNAGWLTAAAALARTEFEAAPHLIYLPELPFSIDQFVADIKEVNKTYQNVIVVVSEGVKTADGVYICEGDIQKNGDSYTCAKIEQAKKTDSFGHAQLTGTSRALAEVIGFEIPDAKIRSIEFSLLQRCGAHTASQTDLSEAEAIGTAGVKAAVSGETGKMMYFARVSEAPYKIDIRMQDVSLIANVEKTIPRDWINQAGNDVNQPVIDYMLPLIQGENKIKYENGLPVYLKR